MMQIPKWFTRWFHRYGLMHDGWASLDVWQKFNIERIAWRAYQKGKKDVKKNIKSDGRYEQEEKK